MNPTTLKNHQYINMKRLGLAAVLVYAGHEIIGRSCLEGIHYFIFEDNLEVREIVECYGTEKEKAILPSELYEVMEQLMIEAADESL